MAGVASYTPEAINFYRYQKLLLDVGTELYRQVYMSYYQPQTLQMYLSQPTEAQVIHQLVQRRVIRQYQYDLLYPAQGHPDINKLDISLLYSLIRNHSSNPNSPVWGTSPPATDTSLEADVERVREKRNMLAHSVQRVMSDQDFRSNSADLKTVYVRMLKDISNPTMSLQRLEDIVKDVMSSAVDPERERDLHCQLNLWLANDTPMELTNLRREMEIGHAHLGEESRHIKQGVGIVGRKLEKLEKDIEDRMNRFESPENLLLKKEMKVRIESSRSELNTFFENEISYFTKTIGFEKIKSKLQTSNCVVIVGNPGIGKTYLSKFVLHDILQRNEEMQPFYCHSPADVDHLVIGNEKLVLLVDDFCGKYCLDREELREWTKKADKLTTYLRSEKISIIINVRNTVLSQVRNRITTSDHLSNILLAEREINLSTITITSQERERMVHKYITNNEVADHNFLNQLAKQTPSISIGFPFLCKMAKARQTSRKEIERVFSTTDYMASELKQLLNNDRKAYMLLVVAMCCDGKFSTHKMNAQEISTAKKVAQVLEDCFETSKETLVKVQTMLGTYFRDEEDETVHLLHNSVREAIFASFWQEYPMACIELAPVTLLTKLTHLHVNPGKEFHIKKTFYEPLIQRYLNLMAKDSEAMQNIVQIELWECEEFFYCFRRCSFDGKYRDILIAVLQNAQVLSAFASTGNEKLTRFFVDLLRLKHQTAFQAHVRSAIERSSAWGQEQIVTYLIGLGVPSTDSAVLCAAESGSVPILELLIHNGGKPAEASSPEHGNALHIACRAGHGDLTEFLIQRYPELMQEKHKGLEPIFIAVSEGQVDILKMLIKSKRVNIYITTEEKGFSLLHQACFSRQNDVALYLATTYPALVNIKALDGTTAVQAAAYGCRLDVLECFSNWKCGRLCHGRMQELCGEKGSNAMSILSEKDDFDIISRTMNRPFDEDIANETGMTIRHFACFGGQLDLTKSLIEMYDPMFSTKKTHDGSSFLHFAAAGGNVDVFRYLLDIGMRAYDVTYSGETVFHKACQHGHLQMIRYLHDNFPDLQDERTISGETCVHHAAVVGDINVLKCLTDTGMDIAAVTKSGETVFHMAAINGKTDFLKFLRSNFSYFQNNRTHLGETVLHYAAAGGHVETLKYLIDTGHDVSGVTKECETLFHKAAFSGKVDMLKYLRANFKELQSHRTHRGETCLHDAAAGGHIEALKYLITTGMDVLDTTEEGKTAMHIASINCRIDMLKYLHANYPDMQRVRTHFGETCLHQAASGGDVDTLKYLIDIGMDVSVVSNTGESVFHAAAFSGRTGLLKYLHSNFPGIEDNRTLRGEACVHFAAAGGHTETLKYLIDAGMDISMTTNEGETVFHRAAVNGRLDLLKYLHSKFAYLESKRTRRGQTCLYHAASGGNVDVLKYLVNIGMDISALSTVGETVFHAAAISGRLDMLKYLHSTVADLLKNRTCFGETCLHYAASGKGTNTLTYLLETGMEISDLTNKGETVFHVAAFMGRIDVLKYLHSRYTKMKETRTLHGETCLHSAASGGSIDVLEFLLGVGMSIYDLAQNGETVFHRASSNGRVEMLAYLHSRFSELQGNRTKNGQTCLHHAASGGHIDALKYLMNTGMDISQVTNDGETVFHRAAINGRVDMLKFLQSNFSELKDIRTFLGHTCLHHAAAGGSTDALKYLVEVGMDISDVTYVGETVFHVASINGQQDMVSYLNAEFPHLRKRKGC